MVEIYEGTVFNTTATTIVNTVNCKGAMGAGVALEFQLRFPKMFEDYEMKCDIGEIRIGKMDYYNEGELLIVNFPTKYDFKYPSKIEWIENGLQDFVNTYSLYEINSIAFPKLGAGKGGLDWNQVKSLMIKYLDPLDINAFICEDTLPYAEGKEKQMVDMLNTMPLSMLSKYVRLNVKQKSAIEKSRPYKRFWHLGKTESIGSKAYQNLFTFFYGKCDNHTDEQLRLF